MWHQRIVGQKKIIDSLHESVALDTLSHAMIIEGRSGYGGLPLALSLAQHLLCAQPVDARPCGKCKHCTQVESLVHPDLHFAFPVVKKEGIQRKDTIASHFMPEWREEVLQNPYLTYNEWIRSISKTSANGDINVTECNHIFQQLTYQSFSGVNKVQIIWIADRLGSNGNKLLKLIEEPPEGTYIMLICDDLGSLLQTIISRCRLIRLSPIQDEDMIHALTATELANEEKAGQVAFLSDGDFSQALGYVHLESNDLMDMCLRWWQICDRLDLVNLRKWSAEFNKYNLEEQKAILGYSLKMIQNLMYLSHLSADMVKLTPIDKEKLTRFSSAVPFAVEDYQAFSEIIAEMMMRIQRNVQSRMVMFGGSLGVARLFNQAKTRKTPSIISG